MLIVLLVAVIIWLEVAIILYVPLVFIFKLLKFAIPLFVVWLRIPLKTPIGLIVILIVKIEFTLTKLTPWLSYIPIITSKLELSYFGYIFFTIGEICINLRVFGEIIRVILFDVIIPEDAVIW